MSNELPILTEGDAALDARKKNVKVRFLKAGESLKGRFIDHSPVKFLQHGDFATKLVSHACLDPLAKKERRPSTCPSCLAGLKAKEKTLVWMWDGVKNELVVKDIAPDNLEGLRAAKDTYGWESLTSDTFVISLADKGAISVSLLPQGSKAAKDVSATGEATIDNDVVAYCMGYRSADEVAKLIEGKAPAAKPADADVKIEKVDGQAAGPKGENGAELF